MKNLYDTLKFMDMAGYACLVIALIMAVKVSIELAKDDYRDET